MTKAEGDFATYLLADQTAAECFVIRSERALARVIHVERVTPRAMIRHQVAWQDLCGRALEANIFLEPAFALPLIQHAPSGRRPTFLLVWEENDAASFGRLIGLLPLLSSSAMMPGVARGFADEQVKLGTPLLDRRRAPEALDAMLGFLGETMPTTNALRLSGLDAKGKVRALLEARCAATGRAVHWIGRHRRAVLKASATRIEAAEVATSGIATPDTPTNVMSFMHAKKRKELGRQRRRLSERGVRTYTSATTPKEVARAAERFLALEHRGWKGERGTALLTRPALATFTRTMTRLMAHDGKCRIDSIEIDGVAVAMGIVLTAGDRAHFWKTTFHEAFAPMSPGVQFALELTERQLGDHTIALTDSCAMPDHPMIDRIWPDRMEVTDVLVCVHPGASRRFAWTCRREQAARSLRASLKALHFRLVRMSRKG